MIFRFPPGWFARLSFSAFALLLAAGPALAQTRPVPGAPSASVLGRQLIVAAEAGDENLVEKLLSSGADLEWRDGRRRTALLPCRPWGGDRGRRRQPPD